MEEPQAAELTMIGRDREPDWDHAFGEVLVELGSRRSAHAAGELDGALLRCVSSGYMEHGCSCEASVPADVVGAAWRRELERDAGRGGRFFRFAWRDEIWLAYGLGDGRVRGVYCPAHSAERDRRATAAQRGVRVGSTLAAHAVTRAEHRTP